MTERPFLWERSYPPGVHWDTPIVTTTLPKLLADAVEAYGSNPALQYRQSHIAFDELGQKVDATAAALIRAKLGRGDALALYLPNTPYHPFSFFGGTMTGARVVHLSPLDAERELAHKLRDSGARVLVTTNVGQMQDRALKLLDQGLLDLVIVGDDLAHGASGAPVAPVAERPDVVRFERFVAHAVLPERWPEIAPDDIALLQYTGGTTGMPKGAILSHANLTAAVSMYEAWFAGQPGYTPPEPSGTALPGPDAEAMAAAEAMTPEDRRRMVEGMVEGLETRLATQGGAPDEWARLIGALVVIGRQDHARDILAEARARFAATPEALAVIAEAAGKAGLE